MEFGLWAMASVFVANLVVGTGLVLAVYGLMERRLALGVVGGLVLGAIVVWAQATVGEQLFTLSFEAKRGLVVVAGVGTALGLVGTMTAVRPELE